MTYSGVTAPIPIGLRGLDGRKNPDVIPAGALTKANAIQFDGTVIGAEGGAEKIDSAGVSGTPICRGLHDWWPTAGTQRLVSYWSDGSVYKETNNDLDATTLKSGLSKAVLGQFVEGGEEDLGNNRKLFLLNGVDSPQVLAADGTTMAAISSPAADWTGSNQPIAAVVHGAGVGSAGGGYMWYALGHRAYRSKADDHEDMLSTVYTMVFFPGLGTEILQMLTFNGLLYIFKDKGICWLDDSNPDDTKWAPRIKSVVHGIPSPQAALAIGGQAGAEGSKDVIFMDNTANFHLLSSVQQVDRDSGDVQASSLSHALFVDEIIRDEINVDRLDLVTSRWYPDKRIAMFSAPGKTSQTPNRRLTWDFSNPDLPRFHISERDEPYALGMRVDPTAGISKPIFGDGSGNVYRMDLPKISKDGSGYTKQFDIAQTDFEYLDPKLKDRMKHFDYLEVFFRSHGPQTLDITPIIDGVPKTAVSIEMQGPGIGLGTAAIGTTFKLAGGSGTFSRKAQLTGSGRAIALSCENSGNAENLEISGINVLFRPGGSKPSGRN